FYAGSLAPKIDPIFGGHAAESCGSKPFLVRLVFPQVHRVSTTTFLDVLTSETHKLGFAAQRVGSQADERCIAKIDGFGSERCEDCLDPFATERLSLARCVGPQSGELANQSFPLEFPARIQGRVGEPCASMNEADSVDVAVQRRSLLAQS